MKLVSMSSQLRRVIASRMSEEVSLHSSDWRMAVAEKRLAVQFDQDSVR